MHVTYIMNNGCDSCGGATYDAPIPVDWDRRTVAEHDVEFTADYGPNGWEIFIAAC